MLVTLKGQRVSLERESQKKSTMSGSFCSLFFILSAASAILISLLSELSKYKKYFMVKKTSKFIGFVRQLIPSFNLNSPLLYIFKCPYWLISINILLKGKVFSCFRIQRQFYLFIAAMISTENVLYKIIEAIYQFTLIGHHRSLFTQNLNKQKRFHQIS